MASDDPAGPVPETPGPTSLRTLKPHLDRAARLAVLPGKVGVEMARAALAVAGPALRREMSAALRKAPE